MLFNRKVSMQRFVIIGLLAMLCALSISMGTAKPASAATSCYGGAVSFAVQGSGVTIGPYYTTSRCHDINIRFTNLTFNEPVCVIFVNHTNACNYWTIISPYDTSWHVIASDVLDGTKFDVYLYSGFTGVTLNGYLAF